MITGQAAMDLLARVSGVAMTLPRVAWLVSWLWEVKQCQAASQVAVDWPARLLCEFSRFLDEMGPRWNFPDALRMEVTVFAGGWDAGSQQKPPTPIKELVAVRTAVVELAKRFPHYPQMYWNTFSTVDIVNEVGRVMGLAPSPASLIADAFDRMDVKLAPLVREGTLHVGTVLSVLMLVRDTLRPFSDTLAERLVFKETEAASQ